MIYSSWFAYETQHVPSIEYEWIMDALEMSFIEILIFVVGSMQNLQNFVWYYMI